MIIRKLPVYLALLSLVGLAFGVGYISYPLLHGAESSVGLPIEETEMADAGADDEAMQIYWEAWHLLEQDFFGEKPDPTTRTYGAIRGMVESFNDPYTYFVEPQPRVLERDELRGKFGGIGATIEQTDSGYVLHPMPDQPAAAAGIEDGDQLLRVDDTPISLQQTMEDVVTLVRGPVGTDVTLEIRRSTGTSSVVKTIPITRAEIETPSVEWRMLEDTAPGTRIGYIQQTIFSERSPAEMQTAVDELLAQDADSLILDLRGNPGGLVQAAVRIADMWLEAGPILVERRADGSEASTEAQPGAISDEIPLVILVDAGSASASEILAGALQDHQRAVLVGETTFGKGSVQLIHELPDQSSLHVTNAQWLTPDRHMISEQGLTPDVVIGEGEDPLVEAIAAAQRAVVAQALPATETP